MKNCDTYPEIISMREVSIKYITGDLKDIGIKEYLIKRLTGRYRINEFWAVKGVSLTLERGDMLGIIGTNGAGKSTLLKAVSGIMLPTRGSIIINGTVAALLELGSGFDDSLTVKENTYLRGALMGYTRAFMKERYRDIIDFAELGEVENKQFKQLSSGMKSRLAFSIASLVEPDVLILDEVLSVGDGAFRARSEEKMRSIIKRGAVTVLVTHSTDEVRKSCNKILWLEKGETVESGYDVNGILNRYESFLKEK